MMTKSTIIGRIDTENKAIALYKEKVTRLAKPDDIVLSGDEFHRMVWNHNGQRLTSVNITDLVMRAWQRSEERTNLLAVHIEADRIIAEQGDSIRRQLSLAQVKPRLALVQRRRLQAVQ